MTDSDHDQHRAAIIERMRGMHNHIGIAPSLELRRLIGFYEDDRDCYYMVIDIRGDISYETAVGEFISLQKALPDHYDRLHEIFIRNGGDMSPEFLICSPRFSVGL